MSTGQDSELLVRQNICTFDYISRTAWLRVSSLSWRVVRCHVLNRLGRLIGAGSWIIALLAIFVGGCDPTPPQSADATERTSSTSPVGNAPATPARANAPDDVDPILGVRQDERDAFIALSRMRITVDLGLGGHVSGIRSDASRMDPLDEAAPFAEWAHYVASLPALSSLVIWHHRVTPTDWRFVCDSTSLRVLDLTGVRTEPTSEPAKEWVAPKAPLTWVSVVGVVDRGLVDAALSCATLEELHGDGVSIDARVIDALVARDARVRVLALRRVASGADVLRALTSLDSIETLELPDTALDLEGMETLATLPALTRLVVRNGALSDDDLARFRAAHPRILLEVVGR